MARAPAPRAPSAPLTPSIEEFYACYARVYASCAGYGMREEACARYAKHAVSSMAELGLVISDEAQES